VRGLSNSIGSRGLFASRFTHRCHSRPDESRTRRALDAKLILEINSLIRHLKPSRSVTSRLNQNSFSYLGLLAVSVAIQRHAGK
jgi:hypothetical protein